MQESMLSRDELLKIARQTKESLFYQWEKDGQCFIDQNLFQKQGVLPEAVGMVGLLLLHVAFCDEKTVFTEEDIQTVESISKKSMHFIFTEIREKGYSFEPLCDSGITQPIVNNNEGGYIDTLTFVFSACILLRYLQRNGLLRFDDKFVSEVLLCIQNSLRLLLLAQNDNGTWGFSAEQGCKPSLYFTYSAGTTLADFYDYIMGEIQSVEKEKKTSSIHSYRDEELVDMLKKSMGADICDKLDKARNKLADWILKNCLPALPRIAACRKLSANDADLIAAFNTVMPAAFIQMDKENNETIDYYNLYYAYYIIDLLVSTTADQIFFDKVNQGEVSEYQNSYKKYMAKQDYKYYFEDKEGEISNLCNDYLEQAVHLTRSNFLTASRTGESFWNGYDNESELKVKLEYEDKNKADKSKAVIGRIKKITEPTLLPLALRANAQYVYYVTNRADQTLEGMMSEIEKDRKMDDNGNPLLWDKIQYNLFITERSIESIVDYYDYINKYSVKSDLRDAESADAFILPFTNLVKQYVDEYLKSDAGIGLIRSAAVFDKRSSSQMANPQAVSARADKLPQLADIVGLLDEVKEKLATDAISNEDDPDDRALNLLIDIFKKLDEHSWISRLSQRSPYKTQKAEKLKSFYSRYCQEYDVLMNCFVTDIASFDAKALYEKVKGSDA